MLASEGLVHLIMCTSAQGRPQRTTILRQQMYVCDNKNRNLCVMNLRLGPSTMHLYMRPLLRIGNLCYNSIRKKIPATDHCVWNDRHAARSALCGKNLPESGRPSPRSALGPRLNWPRGPRPKWLNVACSGPAARQLGQPWWQVSSCLPVALFPVELHGDP